MKPTESISEAAYRIIKKYIQPGGFWVWICSSKDTDIKIPGVEKKSYIIGAIYITAIIPTEQFRKEYPKQRAMEQYTHSKNDGYQAIIPMDSRARLELKEYIEVHKFKHHEGENRELGVWKPKESAELYKKLQEAEFV